MKKGCVKVYPSIAIIGSPVTALTLDEQVSLMVDWARQRHSKYVCIANVHMLIEAHRDLSFRTVLEDADLVAADGMPLVWMMRLLGVKNQDRLAGLDVFAKLCKHAEAEGIPIFFLGSTTEVLNAMRIRLVAQYPNLIIAGMESPPFRPLTGEETTALAQRINSSEAGLLFVALGCPKQERWMYHHKDQIKSVMVGLGGAFPVFAGLQKRAPSWVRLAGLEWVYRLAQEPRRLWKRYLTTNIPFIFLVAMQLGSKCFRRNL